MNKQKRDKGAAYISLAQCLTFFRHLAVNRDGGCDSDAVKD